MQKLLLTLVLLIIPSVSFGQDLVNDLQKVSVTVETGRGSGSGVIRTRKVDNQNVNFIITAAHVVDGLKTSREVVDGKTGTKRTVVEFADAQVVQSINEDGRLVARYSLLAKVIKFSEPEDLAVLQVRKKNVWNESAKVYLDEKLPQLGWDVWNVGSALGIDGANTVSKGIFSQHGRLLNGVVYDQVSCPGFPGCSGSGLFLNDGRMAGLLVRGAGETYILCVPARRIVAWTKSAGIEWVINDTVPTPTQAELNKMIVEDNGVIFDYKASAAPGRAPHTKKLLYSKDDIQRLMQCFPL